MFFGLNTVGVFLSLHRASVALSLLMVQWLIGLGAIVSLWRRETTQFIGPG